MNATKLLISFFICLFIPLAVGALSAFATAAAVSDWYVNLLKPSFNPPSYLFGRVWTVLYILMGISLFLIWHAPKGEFRSHALKIFAIQMGLNFLWSFLFFKFRLTGIAFLEIIVLWMFIILMIRSFFRVNKTAAALQIPYLLWVTFAAILNGSIWFLNWV